ncbi:Alpha-D-ribose 1-methylphosphonate 5-triphosphate synthase subunit PhnH [compost metagenome]
MESLTDGDAAMLSGPGIQTRQTLRAAGLPDGFWREWRRNHQRFPLGVDVFLTQGRRICGLPRSTRVES